MQITLEGERNQPPKQRLSPGASLGPQRGSTRGCRPLGKALWAAQLWDTRHGQEGQKGAPARSSVGFPLLTQLQEH